MDGKIEDLLWDMLFSADDDGRTSALDSLCCAGPVGSEELRRRPYPLLTDPVAGAEIEHKLGLETEADTSWQLDEDRDDDAEEEDEDDEGFMDTGGP